MYEIIFQIVFFFALIAFLAIASYVHGHKEEKFLDNYFKPDSEFNKDQGNYKIPLDKFTVPWYNTSTKGKGKPQTPERL